MSELRPRETRNTIRKLTRFMFKKLPAQYISFLSARARRPPGVAGVSRALSSSQFNKRKAFINYEKEWFSTTQLGFNLFRRPEKAHSARNRRIVGAYQRQSAAAARARSLLLQKTIRMFEVCGGRAGAGIGERGGTEPGPALENWPTNKHLTICLHVTVLDHTVANRVQHKSGPAQPVKHHTLIESKREVSDSIVMFCTVSDGDEAVAISDSNANSSVRVSIAFYITRKAGQVQSVIKAPDRTRAVAVFRRRARGRRGPLLWDGNLININNRCPRYGQSSPVWAPALDSAFRPVFDSDNITGHGCVLYELEANASLEIKYSLYTTRIGKLRLIHVVRHTSSAHAVNHRADVSSQYRQSK
ncbi:hypothetical protein EVAR_480_1 [Eumeta japonica]|uniref:Uncharacterized protein n=1 Tax=Eumeta variegata TaxID=151549 RepID=A0A4C1SAS0_EUMVA|nr:hypothetical protein EVAR_480_1 [Eumeta japonica]